MNDLHLTDPLMRLNKKEIKNHVITWAIIIAYTNITSPLPGSWLAKTIVGAIEALNYMFVFYSFRQFFFPRFWLHRQIYMFVICIFTSYCVFAIVTYLNYLEIIPYLGCSIFYRSILFLLMEDIFLFFIIVSAAGASFFYYYSTYNLKLQIYNGKSLLIKELNFLKNQFNSHITFNFLNYCYSKIHKKLPDTAESIGLFSDMLRYTLQTKPEERVALINEINNIENFINLQKLLNQNVYATFNYEGETMGNFILPRILITFVENAFKHGEYNDSHVPILVNLKVHDQKLIFTVTNKMNPNKRMTGTHTGLENVKQMLNLYYTNRYTLRNSEQEDFYIIELSMELGISNKSTAQIVKPKQGTMSTEKLGIKSLMRLSKKQIKRHVIIWALFITFLEIKSSPIPGTWVAYVFGVILIYLNIMLVYYCLSLFIFPKFWENKRILLYISIFFCLLLYWVNYYISCIKIIPALGGTTYFQQGTLLNFLNVTLYYFLIIGSASAASFFSRYGLYKLKQQAEKEKLLLARELAFLKDQFNSHFTFNFLNYCYCNIYKHSPETAESICVFADMLQYTLQTGPEEKVTISKEITYIENFISIQRLLTSEVCVDFSYDSTLGDKKILSRVLVIFVENAFKHGILNKPSSPISINLKDETGQLVFTVKNEVKRPLMIPRPHKEMENVTQILDLYYANNYELKRVEEDGFYSVQLKMVLGEEPTV